MGEKKRKKGIGGVGEDGGRGRRGEFCPHSRFQKSVPVDPMRSLSIYTIGTAFPFEM